MTGQILTIERVTRNLIVQRGPLALVIQRNGLPGAPGGGGSAAPVRFDQASALATWTVNHNLGREVTPQIYSLGGVMLAAEILRVSLNQFQVLFDVPTAGFALYH